jgi:hypothetical protein
LIIKSTKSWKWVLLRWAVICIKSKLKTFPIFMYFWLQWFCVLNAFHFCFKSLNSFSLWSPAHKNWNYKWSVYQNLNIINWPLQIWLIKIIKNDKFINNWTAHQFRKNKFENKFLNIIMILDLAYVVNFCIPLIYIFVLVMTMRQGWCYLKSILLYFVLMLLYYTGYFCLGWN